MLACRRRASLLRAWANAYIPFLVLFGFCQVLDLDWWNRHCIKRGAERLGVVWMWEFKLGCRRGAACRSVCVSSRDLLCTSGCQEEEKEPWDEDGRDESRYETLSRLLVSFLPPPLNNGRGRNKSRPARNHDNPRQDRTKCRIIMPPSIGCVRQY